MNVDYKHKKTKVTYYAERTNIENIKTAIANVGYDADDITANDESYQKLPKCCKNLEDGGGKWRNKTNYKPNYRGAIKVAKESPDSIEQRTGE